MNVALIQLIVAWGMARNIILGGTVKDQFFKLASEMGEWATGIVTASREELMDGIGDSFVVITLMARQLGVNVEDLYAVAHEHYSYNRNDLSPFVILGDLADALAKGQDDKAKMHLGRLALSLVDLAASRNLDFEECVQLAYDSIKDRKGVMYKGVFIKSTDERYFGALDELGLVE